MLSVGRDLCPGCFLVIAFGSNAKIGGCHVCCGDEELTAHLVAWYFGGKGLAFRSHLDNAGMG